MTNNNSLHSTIHNERAIIACSKKISSLIIVITISFFCFSGCFGRYDNSRITPIDALHLHDSRFVKYMESQKLDVNVSIDGTTLLIEAAKKNEYEKVKYLIEKGANINAQDHLGETALFKAISSKKIVEYLIEKGANINVANKLGETPLMIAMSLSANFSSHKNQKNNEIVEFLIRKGADVNSKNKLGETALIYAIKNDSKTTIHRLRLLIENKAEMDVVDSEGRNPLLLAASKGYIDAVKILVDYDQRAPAEKALIVLENKLSLQNISVDNRIIDSQSILVPPGPITIMISFYGIDLEILPKHEDGIPKSKRVKYTGESSLGISVETGGIYFIVANENYGYHGRRSTWKPEITRYYKRLKALDKELIQAVKKKNEIPVIENLISKGANVNTIDAYGSTALIEASKSRGNYDIIKLLVKNGAIVNAKNNKNSTALIEASKNESNIDVVKFLVKNGANVNDKDNKGNTALNSNMNHFALDAIEFLIANGADVNTKNNQGNTPLSNAIFAYWASIDVVKFLITNGAEINCRNSYGRTPLHRAACRVKGLNFIKALVANGANVNITDKNGWTPLMCAAHLNGAHPEVLEYLKVLITNGANINATSYKGETALLLAKQGEKNALAGMGSEKVIKFLITSGAKI